MPDGYELIDEGWRAWPISTAEWSISYARDQTMTSMVTVRTLREPRYPALMRLVEPVSPELDPASPQIVDVNGYEGVLSSGGLVFDVSPILQIQIARDPYAARSPNTDHALIDFASSLVGITTEQLAELKAAADSNPLVPTDMACTEYLAGIDPRSDDPSAFIDQEQLVVSLGATITVDLITSQPLVDIGFRPVAVAFSGTPPDVNPNDIAIIGTLDALTDTATIDLTWDGTLLDGTAAPPGYYAIMVSAEPQDPTDISKCGGRSGSTGPIQALFRIPA